MKLGAVGVHHAMGWPDATALLEMRGVWRMPIAANEDWRMRRIGRRGPLAEDGHDAVALGNSQSTARTEIDLRIHQQERVAQGKRGRSRRHGHGLTSPA